MAPYVMQINMTNKTNTTLEQKGVAFYDQDGSVQVSPSNISAQSTGSGGILQKVGGSDGLFGLVAYSAPDSSQMLVIWTTMPAATGSSNTCWVGLTSSSTAVNDQLATAAYNGKLSPFSQNSITWQFTQNKQDFALIVTPKVNDPKAYSTFSTVTVELYKRPDGSS